jgi:NlpC/P60 family putative phage cell wall peptidase
MDWAETSTEDRLLDAAKRNFQRIDDSILARGHLILFRWSPSHNAKHAGICISSNQFIHAYSGVGVVQSPLVAAWKRRIADVFAFPMPFEEPVLEA